MVHLKNKTICSVCWATIDLKDTACPVCSSTVNKNPSSDDDHIVDVIDLVEPHEESPKYRGTKISLATIVSILVVLLAVIAIGLTYGKDAVVAEPVIVEDFIGEWEVTGVVGLEDLINKTDDGVGMKFSLWKKDTLIESSSPLPGRLDFRAGLDENLLRGDYTMIYSDSIANPVVAELSRDKKNMTIYFKIEDIGTRIDTIIRLKRNDSRNVKSAIFSQGETLWQQLSKNYR